MGAAAAPAHSAQAGRARVRDCALGVRRRPDALRQALAKLAHALAGEAAELAPCGCERCAAAAVPAPVPNGDPGGAAGLGVLRDGGQLGLE